MQVEEERMRGTRVQCSVIASSFGLRLLVFDSDFGFSSSPFGHNSQQNNGSLDCPLPVRFKMKMGERGADAGEQDKAQRSAPEISTTAGNGDAPHHDGGNRFELEAGAGFWVNLW